MRAFWLVSAFVIFILSGQISMPDRIRWMLFLPGCIPWSLYQVFGNLSLLLWFGGSPEIFQATFITGNAMWERIVAEDPLLVTVSNLDITEHFAKMTRGRECNRRNFTLRMHGNPEQAILPIQSVLRKLECAEDSGVQHRAAKQ